ncbi:hypothetical protein E2C01_007439 [Portunus trituberculatus]|uniref:Uncharacterized protein n=1 Tax=Portunus trituberculatus TaxID=210409 RepID=A0A5B7CZG1_PORTR|nr:hypothetical protein [Portunus trituberculatus]
MMSELYLSSKKMSFSLTSISFRSVPVLAKVCLVQAKIDRLTPGGEQDLLSIVGQPKPTGSLAISEGLHPLHELVTSDSIRHDQRELRVKALGSEQLVEEGSEQPLVKFIVNLATINALGHEGGQGIPWYFLWRQICSTLWEKQNIWNRLGNSCPHPWKALNPKYLPSKPHRAESSQQVGTDAWWRLKHKHTASTQEVDRQAWCDLHGEEEPELWMWVKGVELLL